MTSSSNPEVDPRSVIKAEDGFLAYWFSAQVANRIARGAKRFLPWLTPDWFTASSLLLGLLAAYLFSTGVQTNIIWGVVVLHVSFIFDCCDGQLARLTGMKIRRGAWFDYHSDKIKDGFILLGFAYGAFTQSGQTAAWVLIVAFLGIFFQFLRNINALNRDITTMEVIGHKDKARTFFDSSGKGQLLRTLKHSALFKLSDRVLLYTIFGLSGWLAAGVVVYACLAFFFSTVSGLLNYKVFQGFDKSNPL